MEPIHITLPDGKVEEVPKGTTPADIARKISPRLADAALVASIVHYGSYTVRDLKECMAASGVPVRIT